MKQSETEKRRKANINHFFFEFFFGSKGLIEKERTFSLSSKSINSWNRSFKSSFRFSLSSIASTKQKGIFTFGERTRTWTFIEYAWAERTYKERKRIYSNCIQNTGVGKGANPSHLHGKLIITACKNRTVTSRRSLFFFRLPFFIDPALALTLLTRVSAFAGSGIKVTRDVQIAPWVKICHYKPSGMKGRLDGGERVAGDSRRARRKARS